MPEERGMRRFKLYKLKLEQCQWELELEFTTGPLPSAAAHSYMDEARANRNSWAQPLEEILLGADSILPTRPNLHFPVHQVFYHSPTSWRNKCYVHLFLICYHSFQIDSFLKLMLRSTRRIKSLLEPISVLSINHLMQLNASPTEIPLQSELGQMII